MANDSVPDVILSSDIRSRLMGLAYDEIHRVKKTPKWVPVRLIHHIPNLESILRPIDYNRVGILSEDILTNGYRESEPVFTSPLFTPLGLPRYFIGGNHRGAATRDSGKVLIPSYILSEKVILKMMTLLAESYPPQSHSLAQQRKVKEQMFYRCLTLVMVATQIKEPSPKPSTVLQMVALIRAFVKNDPEISSDDRGKKYGGLDVVRSKLFGSTPLHTDSRVHFLLNKTHTRRHLNKCLKGSYILIETRLRQTFPALGDRNTLLDLHSYWEERCLTPTFNVSHLCHVSDMGPEAALEKTEKALELIYKNMKDGKDNPAIHYAPFYKPNPLTIKRKEEAAREEGEGDFTENEDEDIEDNGDEEEAAASNPPRPPKGKKAAPDNNAQVHAPRRSTRNKKRTATYKGSFQASSSSKKRRIERRPTAKEIALEQDLEALQTRLKNAATREDVLLKREREKLKKYEELASLRLTEAATWKEEAEAREKENKTLAQRLSEKTAQQPPTTAVREAQALSDEQKRQIEEELRKKILKEVQEKADLQSQLEIKTVKEAMEKLRQEREDMMKDLSKRESEEVARLKRENELLKADSSSRATAPEDNTVKEEILRLREENEGLKARLEESSQTRGGRAKRPTLPTNRQLSTFSKRQLESFLQRATEVMKDLE